MAVHMLVPHDVEGLVECFGSKEAFVNKLDSLFLANGDMEMLLLQILAD